MIWLKHYVELWRFFRNQRWRDLDWALLSCFWTWTRRGCPLDLSGRNAAVLQFLRRGWELGWRLGISLGPAIFYQGFLFIRSANFPSSWRNPSAGYLEWSSPSYPATIWPVSSYWPALLADERWQPVSPFPARQQAWPVIQGWIRFAKRWRRGGRGFCFPWRSLRLCILRCQGCWGSYSAWEGLLFSFHSDVFERSLPQAEIGFSRGSIGRTSRGR